MESELDGLPMSGGEGEGEDLDGVPLDGAALLKGAMKHSRPLPAPDDDLDGVPSKLHVPVVIYRVVTPCSPVDGYICFRGMGLPSSGLK